MLMAPAKKKKPKLSVNSRLYKKVYDEEFGELHRDMQVQVIEEPQSRYAKEFTKRVIRKAEELIDTMEEGPL